MSDKDFIPWRSLIIKKAHQGKLAIGIVGTIREPSTITMTASCILWETYFPGSSHVHWSSIDAIDEVINHIVDYYQMDDAQVGKLTMYVYELKGITLKIGE